jgi:phosphoserine phosphatase
LENNSIERLRKFLVKYKIITIFHKFFPKYGLNKRLKLIQLRGILSEKIDFYSKKFYDLNIKVNLIPQIIEELNLLKIDNYEIWIASGGYFSYIKYFAKEFEIDEKNIVATEINFGKIKCLGTIKGNDCLYEYKLIALKKKLSITKNNFYSISFSDSITDLPLLKWSDKGIVISKNNSQKWAETYNLNEIII